MYFFNFELVMKCCLVLAILLVLKRPKRKAPQVIHEEEEEDDEVTEDGLVTKRKRVAPSSPPAPPPLPTSTPPSTPAPPPSSPPPQAPASPVQAVPLATAPPAVEAQEPNFMEDAPSASTPYVSAGGGPTSNASAAEVEPIGDEVAHTSPILITESPIPSPRQKLLLKNLLRKVATRTNNRLPRCLSKQQTFLWRSQGCGSLYLLS